MQIHGDAPRFGLHSGQQYGSVAEAGELWTRAERLGFDWVSLFDHYRPPLGGPAGPCLDGPTLLAALAARTGRVRCGLLVAAVTWRHPAVAAAIATTLDHVSGGRLEFGVGAAGPDLAYRQWGIALPPAAVRVRMLDETCRILRSLWTRESTTFAGEHYRLTNARLEPKPVQSRLPLVVGGAGRGVLRVAAEHADIWNALAGDHYRAAAGVLAGHCAELGRDPADVRRSVTFRVVLGADRADAERRGREVLGALPADSPDRAEYLTVGTPQQCADALAGYAELGVRDFLLGARPPVDWTTVTLFAERVVPELRRRYGPAR